MNHDTFRLIGRDEPGGPQQSERGKKTCAVRRQLGVCPVRRLQIDTFASQPACDFGHHQARRVEIVTPANAGTGPGSGNQPIRIRSHVLSPSLRPLAIRDMIVNSSSAQPLSIAS